MSVITFTNAAALVLARLRPLLPAMTFVHDIPTTRPAQFIRVFRTGGPRTSLVVDGAQLTIESWAADASTAAANAELVRAQLNALPEQLGVIPPIYKVEEMSGPGELPDVTSGSRRFTWTVIVHVRCT